MTQDHDPNALARTISILSKHKPDLLALPGITDAEVIAGADGQPAIVAYCETQQDAKQYSRVTVLLESGNRVRFRVGER